MPPLYLPPEQLLMRIERCLRRIDMGASTFGVRAAKDPKLVFDLREGREPRRKTVAKIITLLRRLGEKV